RGGYRVGAGRKKKKYNELKNQQIRFKEVDDSLKKIAGGEGKKLLQDYLISSKGQQMLETNAYYYLVGENAVDLVKLLPPKSPFRIEILNKLTKSQIKGSQELQKWVTKTSGSYAKVK